MNFRYYSAERGYWMYAQEMEQIQEENGVQYDGKRLRLKPFLAISNSRDGKKIQTITSDRAIIDLNQPLGFSAGPDGEPLKVKHVLLEPNVVIRDNKGTPNDRKDDMTIDQLTTLEYDEPTQQITSESHVVIQDAEMVTSGDGMLVQLGKSDDSTPGDSSGFDGVEYLELFRNVHVVMHDVGKSGMMPGESTTATAHKSGGRGKGTDCRRAGPKGAGGTRAATDSARSDMRLQDAGFPGKDSCAGSGRAPCSAAPHHWSHLTEMSLCYVAVLTNNLASSRVTI